MSVIRCTHCGSREIDPKISNSHTAFYLKRKNTYYCSKDCYRIDNVGLNLAYLPLWLIMPIYPFWITCIIHIVKGTKLRKAINYKQSKKIKLCFYCQSEIADIPEGKGVCMGCGEIIHFCDLCQKHIFSGDEILQLEPCGHIFHKGELLDWIDNNKVCPKCAAEVDFVDIEPE